MIENHGLGNDETCNNVASEICGSVSGYVLTHPQKVFAKGLFMTNNRHDGTVEEESLIKVISLWRTS